MVSTFYALLSIITLTFIDIASSTIKCGSLKITCASGEAKCYSGPCATFLSYMVDHNTLPLFITPSPTLRSISLEPTQSPASRPTAAPTHNPINTALPTRPPTAAPARQPTTAPTRQQTATATATPTSTSIGCTQCNCECAVCNEEEQCMHEGTGCIWLISRCFTIPDHIHPSPLPTTSTSTSTTIIPTKTPTTTTTMLPTATPSTKTPTTNSPTSIPLTTVNCNSHFSGLYLSESILLQLTLTEKRFVNFDACHADLPPIIRVFDADMNILNECNIYNGCCALSDHDSGLLTELAAGIYYFQYSYNKNDLLDLQAVGRDIAIYHVHIACFSVMPSVAPSFATTESPTEDDATSSTTGTPTAATTESPTSTTAPTRAPTSTTTQSPTSPPSTNAPTTNAPTTNAPTTNAPTTKTPTTKAPTTKTPTTKAPTTKTPSKVPTVPPTLRPSDEPTCSECDCDCTVCHEAEQCVVIGTNCIWFHGECNAVTIASGDVNDGLCPLEMVQSMDIILLVDNSCGLDANECNIRQHGIYKFISSILSNSDDPSTQPRIAYMTYSTADKINTSMPLSSISSQMAAEIKDYECDVMGTHSTDISAAISTAMLEFALTADDNARNRKIIIFSNCMDTIGTTSPCPLTNDLSIQGFPIEITVVNIPCKYESDQYDINALQCLTMDTPQRYITLSDATVSEFEGKVNAFKSAVCPSTNAPTSAPANCPQLGDECSSAYYHREERCCDGHKRQGFARCRYTHYDDYGHKLGTCCVRENRPGCGNHTDCCNENRVCYEGYCLKEPKLEKWQKLDGLAIEVSENGDYAEWTVEESESEEEIFGLNRVTQIFGLMMIFMCAVCNLLYCYWKFVARKRAEEEVDDTQIDIDFIRRNFRYYADDENEQYSQQELQF